MQMFHDSGQAEGLGFNLCVAPAGSLVLQFHKTSRSGLVRVTEGEEGHDLS